MGGGEAGNNQDEYVKHKADSAMERWFSLKKSRRAIVNRVFKDCFPEKVTLEQRPEGDDNICCDFCND